MTSASLTEKVPYHQSERNFRRFEPTIANILKNFPNETIIVASDLSSETISHRLRDAIRSVFVHNYIPRFFERSQLESVRNELKICKENNRVIARFSTLKPITQTQAPAFVFNSPSEDIARAAVYIAANALGEVKLLNVTQAQRNCIQAMRSTYDIAIIEDGSAIIVL